MDDKVPFKAYVQWKDQEKPEVRRFGIEKTVVTSFCYLDAKLQDVYPGLKNKSYTVFWKDEEGDDVIISSDEEMIIALSAMNDNLMKLFVYCKDEESKEMDTDIVITAFDSVADNNLSHSGVICDVCDGPVVGFRYKCTSCADYDLCSKCEAAGNHSEHIMVRVPMPNMPRTTIRAAIRRSRHILKGVGTSVKESSECPIKRSKCERTADKKRHHGHHGDFIHSDHHRRSRTSWLETFATYVNEFANLAGDLDGETAKNKDDAAKNAQTASQEQAKDSESVKDAPEKPQPTTSEPQPTTSEPQPTTSDPKPTTSGSDNTQNTRPTVVNQENIQKLLNMVYGIDINQLLSHLASAPLANEKNEQTGNLPHAQRHEADKKTVRSEVSSTSKDIKIESKKEESPEKATDDWTVINNEKDLLDTDGKPTAPYEETRTIGFNLPQEFQERVKISEGQNIYPPLHTASAVLNPKEPELQTVWPKQETKTDNKVPVNEPVKQKISKPSTSQPKTRPEPTQPKPSYHFKPHIDTAIKHMLNMGFTNDGGWLTQLLERTDGDIAAVLELITPVTPKK